MKRTLLNRLLMSAAFSPWVFSPLVSAAELDSKQTTGSHTYVYCALGEDCPEITVKLIDLGGETATKPLAAEVLPVTGPISNEITLLFQLRSSHIDTDELARLQSALAKQKIVSDTQPHPRVIVTGYTDQLGKSGYNRRLAKARADAVYHALLKAGVKRAGISVHSTCCIDHPPTVNPLARKVIIQFQDKIK